MNEDEDDKASATILKLTQVDEDTADSDDDHNYYDPRERMDGVESSLSPVLSPLAVSSPVVVSCVIPPPPVVEEEDEAVVSGIHYVEERAATETNHAWEEEEELQSSQQPENTTQYDSTTNYQQSPPQAPLLRTSFINGSGTMTNTDTTDRSTVMSGTSSSMDLDWMQEFLPKSASAECAATTTPPPTPSVVVRTLQPPQLPHPLHHPQVDDLSHEERMQLHESEQTEPMSPIAQEQREAGSQHENKYGSSSSSRDPSSLHRQRETITTTYADTVMPSSSESTAPASNDIDEEYNVEHHHLHHRVEDSVLLLRNSNDVVDLDHPIACRPLASVLEHEVFMPIPSSSSSSSLLDERNQNNHPPPSIRIRSEEEEEEENSPARTTAITAARSEPRVSTPMRVIRNRVPPGYSTTTRTPHHSPMRDTTATVTATGTGISLLPLSDSTSASAVVSSPPPPPPPPLTSLVETSASAASSIHVVSQSVSAAKDVSNHRNGHGEAKFVIHRGREQPPLPPPPTTRVTTTTTIRGGDPNPRTHTIHHMNAQRSGGTTAAAPLTITRGQSAPTASAGVGGGGGGGVAGRRKIRLRLQEEVRSSSTTNNNNYYTNDNNNNNNDSNGGNLSSNNTTKATSRRSLLGHLRTRSSLIMWGSKDFQDVMNESSSSSAMDRGSITVGWFDGTSSIELQEHVRTSVTRKLGLDRGGGVVELFDFRIIDDSVDPPEEIVLSPFIPDGSKFVLRFTTRDRISDGATTPLSIYSGRAPDSPTATPPTHHHRLLGDFNGGFNASQLALLRKQLNTSFKMPHEKEVSVEENDQTKTFRRKAEEEKKAHLQQETTGRPSTEKSASNGAKVLSARTISEVLEEDESKQDVVSVNGNDDEDALSRVSKAVSDLEDDDDDDNEMMLHSEDPIESRLRQITELLILDRQKKRNKYYSHKRDKRQVIFVLANYFVLFLSLIAISAEIQARAPSWLSSLENQLQNVQHCAENKDALFECVSNGDFAGVIATILLYLSRSVATRRFFLFGFETPKKLWTVVYESLVTSFCWGFSYLFIRRGLNTDTRPRFVQKYWKDAAYGSLAGFNAAFMKHVLKNLIPQEAVEDVLRERQLKFLSWLPSFTVKG